MDVKIAERSVRFPADDGFELAGILTEGPAKGPLVLISTATAAPARFYQAFARACVEAGARAALVYDFRGVATSATPPGWKKRINYKDHALLDFPAAVRFLGSVCPGHPMVGVGQSLGGFALGLSGCHNRFDRYMLVSVISGYLGYIGGPSLWLKMIGIGLPVALVTRQMPRWAFGEPIASSSFVDWARWCLHPEFLFGDPNLPEKVRFEDVDTPLLAVYAADDAWATPASIGAMLERFSKASVRQTTVSPEEAGGAIGHLGFFKAAYAERLWPGPIDWLLSGSE